jgi:pimeloyl-ACP methyl ester carboxylesterase
MPNQRLWYRTSGDGPALVFLHGFLESSTMWDDLSLESLGFQLIFIDLPGHGQSDLLTGEGDPSMAQMAGLVAEVLSDLGIEKFDVVGHSMGGYVALELKQILQGCGRVVLLNSNFWSDSEEKKRDRIRVADLAFKAKDLLVQQAIPGLFFRKEKDHDACQVLIQEAKQLLPESIAYAALAMRNRNDHTGTVTSFPTDFLLMHGEYDPLVSMSFLRERTATVPIQIVILPNAGHMAHIEQAIEIPEVLLTFLNE